MLSLCQIHFDNIITMLTNSNVRTKFVYSVKSHIDISFDSTCNVIIGNFIKLGIAYLSIGKEMALKIHITELIITDRQIIRLFVICRDYYHIQGNFQLLFTACNGSKSLICVVRHRFHAIIICSDYLL